MDALACILSCDGLPSIPQKSDSADKPSTAVNEAALGNPAAGTEEVGMNPEVSYAERTNHDKPLTEPPSEVSISASKAIETTSYLIGQKPLVALAFLVPKEQTCKNPKGPDNKLINGDVDSIRDSIPASKNTKNPSDPTSRGATLGPACLNWMEHTGKTPEEECHIELTNHNESLTNVPSSMSSKGIENPCDSRQNAPIGTCEHITVNLVWEKGILQLWVESDSAAAGDDVLNGCASNLPVPL